MQTPAGLSPIKRLWSLDIFRGLCALLVFLTHWILWCDIYKPDGLSERFVQEFLARGLSVINQLSWYTGGNHPAVIGFFVLSGFCVHAAHAAENSTPASLVDWRTYFINRAKRILPVYWIGCLLGLCFVLLQGWRPSAIPIIYYNATCSPLDSVLRLSGLSSIFPYYVVAGNNPLNTVSTELVIYAVYPLFLFCTQLRAWKILGGALLLAQLAVDNSVPALGYIWVFNSAFMMGLFWYAGALAAHIHFNRSKSTPYWMPPLCWGLFMVTKFLPANFPHRNLLLQILWCCVCTTGLLWLISFEARRPKLGDHIMVRFLRHIGTISYSLYAVHTPIIFMTGWALSSTTLLGRPSYGRLLLFSFIGTIIATYATYYGVERLYFKSKARNQKTDTIRGVQPVS